MLVRELIAALQEMNPEDEVMFEYNTRNYWNQHRADPIGVVRTALVEYSSYLDADSPVDEDKTSIYEWSEALKVPIEQREIEEWDKDYEKMRRVVLLD